jgi:hypothetical protein
MGAGTLILQGYRGKTRTPNAEAVFSEVRILHRAHRRPHDSVTLRANLHDEPEGS